MIGYQSPRSAEIKQDLISHDQSNRVINETVIEMIQIRRDVEENESRSLQATLWMPVALYLARSFEENWWSIWYPVYILTRHL